MDRAPGLCAKSGGVGFRSPVQPGRWSERTGGRGDSSDRSDRSGPAPSERALPRSGFNAGPRSAPLGRRPQRTAPCIPTPTHL